MAESTVKERTSAEIYLYACVNDILALVVYDLARRGKLRVSIPIVFEGCIHACMNDDSLTDQISDGTNPVRSISSRNSNSAARSSVLLYSYPYIYNVFRPIRSTYTGQSHILGLCLGFMLIISAQHPQLVCSMPRF